MPSIKAKQAINQHFKEILIPKLKENNVSISILNDSSYRLVLGRTIMDYYPTSGKYHHITKNIRGVLNTGSLEEILNKLNN